MASFSGPVQIPRSTPTTKQKGQMTTMTDLAEEVRKWTTSFYVSEISSDVAKWLPELRNALPGSLDHFLLMLLDDPGSYHRIQQKMAGALSNYLNAHPEQGTDEDSDEDVDMNSDQDLDGHSREDIDGHSHENIDEDSREETDVNKNPDTPATPDAPSPGNSESRAIDEATFFTELIVLREMLAPLLDKTKPVYWITNRSHQPQDVIEGFQWSKDLIDNYRWNLAPNIWNRHGDWSIYNPSLPGSEARDKNTSLHQWRIEASRATALWEKFPPDKDQLVDFTGRERMALIESDPGLARSQGILPPRKMKAPKPVTDYPLEGCLFKRSLPKRYRQPHVRVINLVKWLALARGFPAVHLFRDLARLFTVYGLDVSNARQVEFCKLLLSKPLVTQDPGQQCLIPHIMGKNQVVNETNVDHVQDQIDSNRVLQLSLGETPSLLSPDDAFKSSGRLRRVLKWEEGAFGMRTLALHEDPSPWNPAPRGSDSESEEEEEEMGECDLDDPATRAYWTALFFPGT